MQITQILECLMLKNYLLNPTDQIEGSWIKAEKDQIKDFSAVAYFFAKYPQ